MCSHDGLFSTESGKRTRSRVMLERKQLQDHFLIFIASRPGFDSLLTLICVSQPPYMLVLAAAPPHYLLPTLSLNSLDREGVRLLSPRDPQILPNSLQVPMIPVQMTQPSSSGSSMKILFVVLFLFPDDQQWSQVGTIRDLAVGLSSFILVPQSDLCVYFE